MEKFPEIDVVYITRHNGLKDRYYFDRLRQLSRNSYYMYHPEEKNFVSGYIKLALSFPFWLLRTKYAFVFVASVNTWYFRAIVKIKKKNAKICTYDDGAGNFYKHGERIHALMRFKDKVFSIPVIGMPISDVINAATHHYTVNSSMTNIAGKEKLKQINMYSAVQKNNSFGTDTAKIFVGQNFSQYLDEDNIARLMKFIADSGCLYLRHPRETEKQNQIHGNVEVVETVKILEDYVDEILSKHQSVEVYGAFTTAFITINSNRVKKIYLSTDRDPEKEKIMRECGCEIRKI